MARQGGCLCGNVRFATQDDPSSIHYCHCSMCRRATGSAFAVLAWFAVSAVRFTGELRCFRSSPIAERAFCGTCGCPISLRYHGQDRLALMVGAFDDASTLHPTHHYGVEGRLPWVDCSASLRAVETRERF